MVIGDIARIGMRGCAWYMAEGVPDRRPATVFIGSTLDLICGARRAPEEPVRKSHEPTLTQLAEAGPDRTLNTNRIDPERTTPHLSVFGRDGGGVCVRVRFELCAPVTKNRPCPRLRVYGWS